MLITEIARATFGRQVSSGYMDLRHHTGNIKGDMAPFGILNKFICNQLTQKP